MSDTVITVTLDTSLGTINFEQDNVPPPFDMIFVEFSDTGSPPSPATIELNREAGATWVFKKLLVWSDLRRGAVVEIPVGVVTTVFDVTPLSFAITGFSDSQIKIENQNRNETNFDIHIHLQMVVEADGVQYISRDPQVIDLKKPTT